MSKIARILAFTAGFVFYSVAISNVWAKSTNFVKISLESITTRATSEAYVNPPVGDVLLGGIPFYISPTNNMAVPPGGGSGSSISVNVANTTKVFLLLNSYNTWYYYNNQKTGEIKLEFSDSSIYTKDIIVGGNIREWREGNDIIPTVNWVTDPASIEVFRGMPTHLAPPAVMDMLTLDLPTNFAGKTLIKVTVADTSVGDPGIIWMGLTVGQSSGLNVPYFSQIDPIWGSQEYDSGNTLDLWCGSTLAQCGCAVTSAAMLLKYYGVDKSPDNLPTTPESLNNWLKNNKGYNRFGAILWNSVATYSIKANENFGTQQIKWNGTGASNDFNTLNNELNSNRPVILSVRNESHFVVATGIQGSTYSINDPISQNNTTLQSYGNIFQGMRLYERTSTDLSTIYISTPAPTEILITDSSGRRIGKDPNIGIVYNEISNSFYFLEPTLVDDSIENAPLSPSGSGVTTLAIINPESGAFNIQVSNLGTIVAIDFAGYDQDGEISTKEFSQTIPQGGTQEYTFNYSPEPGSQIQVTQIVEIDVKPGSGSDPNSLNLKSNGVIPVAILTTPSFNATQVDVSTVRFGPNQAKEIHNKGHLEDIDGDGDIDLLLHFKTQETGIKNTDTQACLTGVTLNGVPIQGCDTIKIIH